MLHKSFKIKMQNTVFYILNIPFCMKVFEMVKKIWIQILNENCKF